MEFEPGPNWYLARTHHGKERVAERNLDNQDGIHSFLPLKKVPAPTRQDRHRFLVLPFFPRYIFIHVDLVELYSKVRNTRGLERLVSFGNEAARIDYFVMRAILDRIGPDGYMKVDDETMARQESLVELKPGQPIVVQTGMMTGREGSYEGRRNSTDVYVFLKTLEGVLGDKKLTIDRGWIRPILLKEKEDDL